MKAKVYFSNVAGRLSDISFGRMTPKAAADAIASAFSQDMDDAARSGCSIYFSNFLCQMSDLMPGRFLLSSLEAIISTVADAALLFSDKCGILVVIGCKDFEKRHRVVIVCQGRIVLDTKNFADSLVSIRPEDDAPSSCDICSVSAVSSDALMENFHGVTCAEAVFVIGSVPFYPSWKNDLEQTLIAMSRQSASCLLFAQEDSFWCADEDVYCRVDLSCDYYDIGGDCKKVIDFTSVAYQKKLLGTHENRFCACQKPLGIRFSDISWDEIAPGRLPLCEMEGDDGLMGAFKATSLNLANKARMIGAEKLVLGLSGGVDSASALLCCLNTIKALGWQSRDIICVSMPCFGTSRETKANSEALARAVDASFYDIPIFSCVQAHLEGIGHSLDVHDKTFENAQARVRALTLFDIANAKNALEVGTSDLSESVLGWCTFQGDQASMFSANIAFSKTQLIRILRLHAGTVAGDVLERILDTPISPELIPPSPDGRISQKSEDSVGPYEIVDSFIYHYFFKGRSVQEAIAFISSSFRGKYSATDIAKWCNFAKKSYYASSFKRLSSMPGPHVTKISRTMSRLFEKSVFPL